VLQGKQQQHGPRLQQRCLTGTQVGHNLRGLIGGACMQRALYCYGGVTKDAERKHGRPMREGPEGAHLCARDTAAVFPLSTPWEVALGRSGLGMCLGHTTRHMPRVHRGSSGEGAPVASVQVNLAPPAGLAKVG
jgi:hypothetical protein